MGFVGIIKQLSQQIKAMDEINNTNKKIEKKSLSNAYFCAAWKSSIFCCL